MRPRGVRHRAFVQTWLPWQSAFLRRFQCLARARRLAMLQPGFEPRSQRVARCFEPVRKCSRTADGRGDWRCSSPDSNRGHGLERAVSSSATPLEQGVPRPVRGSSAPGRRDVDRRCTDRWQPCLCPVLPPSTVAGCDSRAPVSADGRRRESHPEPPIAGPRFERGSAGCEPARMPSYPIPRECHRQESNLGRTDHAVLSRAPLATWVRRHAENIHEPARVPACRHLDSNQGRTDHTVLIRAPLTTRE